MGDCDLDGFSTSPVAVGWEPLEGWVLFPLADLLGACTPWLPSFGVDSVRVDALSAEEFALPDSVWRLSGLMPVLPASPLGLVDSACASTPAESEPERPLGPCE